MIKGIHHNSMKYAFDCHMHILPLGHVCLTAYLEYAKNNPIIEAYAQVSAHDYVIAGILRRQGEALNLVSVMEQPVEKHIEIYEDDLRGKFLGEGETTLPVISDSGVKIIGGGKELSYDKIMICPLLMDFSTVRPLDLYYPEPPVHDIRKQAREVLEGIELYHKNHPEGKIDAYPFLGINPLNHSMEYTEELLNECFPKPGRFSKKSSFAGIKVYPPMGFDPDPEDPVMKEKVELLYTFCEKHSLPIVTHCDDQGFRMLPLEESFTYTSPERWKNVLERHPDLWLDFAHFGEQYYHSRKGIAAFVPPYHQEFSWREMTLSFMKSYPHVYADLSFDGVNPDSWEELNFLLESLPSSEREIYEGRLLYGTDWPLSLSKITSALQYWRGFCDSRIDSDLCDKMLNVNPERFLFH